MEKPQKEVEISLFLVIQSPYHPIHNISGAETEKLVKVIRKVRKKRPPVEQKEEEVSATSRAITTGGRRSFNMYGTP
ncbi:MAG: hypothetical protein ACYTEU_04030 [Planctomycetota bacterium]|jgi:hypothetical protein